LKKVTISTLHITSSTPGEGKTTIAVILRGSFGQTNQEKVLILG